MRISAPRRVGYARPDVIVLGNGLVGQCIALVLQMRGLSVVIIDEHGIGNATSYGNAGVIESSTFFPHAFPRNLASIACVALKRATEANYHFSFLPKVAPWLWQYFKESSPDKLLESAQHMRPLFKRSLSDHCVLMAHSNALMYLNMNGWMHLYRTESAFEEQKKQLRLCAEAGIEYKIIDPREMRSYEPALKPNFHRAVLWTRAANVLSPLKVTESYAKKFRSLGGTDVRAKIVPERNLRRRASFWLVETEKIDYEAKTIVVALGPWMPDFLRHYRINLPFAVKRGYHHHFPITQGCTLSRPVVDEYGYCLAEQEQGIRLTTGAEFADRDAPPTPVQFARLMPHARELLDLGEPLEIEPWMGCRPCLPDSMPVLGRVPGVQDMWIAGGHGHKGLTLSATTGFLMADMILGKDPFCDTKPFSVERFL